jgi:chromosome segregation ATPase
VALTNFVTYTKAEFQCGPNLNMVIGPNGTGKSTLVCAICLALGGATALLGRAKDVVEFVKHGAKRAEVEIELARDTDRQGNNPIITLRINKEDGKCSFYIDRKASTKKAVQELARKFSIQIDNLCQFLPQDRVVEFAALSPVDLLAQTQRAIAPDQMTTWHNGLIAMSRESKQKYSERTSTAEQLKAMEDRQKSQEGEVGRLRERSALQEKAVLYGKLKPFPEYNQLVIRHQEAQMRKKEVRKELVQLERISAPSLEAAKKKAAYIESVTKDIDQRTKVIQRAETTAAAKLTELTNSSEKIKDCVNRVNAERVNNKKAKTAVIDHQKNIRQIQQSLANPPAPFDGAVFNEQIRRKKEEIRRCDDSKRDKNEQMKGLEVQQQQRETIISQAETETQHLQSQAGRQMSKLENVSHDTAKAWKWIQQNRSKFTGEVYGPPMLECSVTDPQQVDVVETIIGRSELMALTVTNMNDFRMLASQVYKAMSLTDVNLRSILQPLSNFRSPMSDEALRETGLECWIRDMIEGPDVVLAMLCDTRKIEHTGYSKKSLNEAQTNAIKQSGISSWVSDGQHNMITRRREYGDAGISQRTNPIKKARLLTDAPVDVQVEQRINRTIAEARSDISDIQEQLKELQDEVNQLNNDSKQLKLDHTALEKEKQVKQSQSTAFAGLPVKLSNAEEKLEAALEQQRGSRDRQSEILLEQDGHMLDKCQHAIDYARLLDTVRDRRYQLLEVEIMQIEAQSDADQLKAQHAREIALIESKRQELEEATAAVKDALERGRVKADVCRSIAAELTTSEREVQEEVARWDPEKLELESQSLQAQLEMLQGGSGNVIKEYEQRAIKIEQRKAKVDELESSLEALHANILEIRQQWEPELDKLIQQISEAFGENFARMHCVGEVAVHKDEDFDKWAIHIKVKFRLVFLNCIEIAEVPS